MEHPSNAAYRRGEARENPAEKMKILGITLRKDQLWMAGAVIGGVLFMTVLFIFFLMPTGISFLAAKNASGLFGFMGLFAAYMFGFLFTILLFFASVVGILYAIQQYA